MANIIHSLTFPDPPVGAAGTVGDGVVAGTGVDVDAPTTVGSGDGVRVKYGSRVGIGTRVLVSVTVGVGVIEGVSVIVGVALGVIARIAFCVAAAYRCSISALIARNSFFFGLTASARSTSGGSRGSGISIK